MPCVVIEERDDRGRRRQPNADRGVEDDVQRFVRLREAVPRDDDVPSELGRSRRDDRGRFGGVKSTPAVAVPPTVAKWKRASSSAARESLAVKWMTVDSPVPSRTSTSASVSAGGWYSGIHLDPDSTVADSEVETRSSTKARAEPLTVSRSSTSRPEYTDPTVAGCG